MFDLPSEYIGQLLDCRMLPLKELLWAYVTPATHAAVEEPVVKTFDCHQNSESTPP